MTGKEGWLIGELSGRVGIPTHTIRYYERLGLLEPPRRTESQYRLYGSEDEERLWFIQKAKRFGLSLEEIKQLIEIRTAGVPPCVSLKAMVKQRLDELDCRLREMMVFRQELASRYQEIRQLFPDETALPTDAICNGKICGLIESID
jgi:DNA-binding transcriptional MerR regulator